MRALAVRVGGQLDVLCEETDRLVVAEFPELAEHTDTAARRAVIEGTFNRVLRALADEPAQGPGTEVHRRFGEAAAFAGIPLDRLVAGYRIGARVGWSRIDRAARELGLDGEAALRVGETVLACIHELTSESVTGYVKTAEAAPDHQAHQRQVLVEALMAGRADPTIARQVTWSWPRELAVAVVPGEPLPNPTRDSDVLIGTADGAVVALGPAEAIARALPQRRLAVIGPTVPTEQAWRSFERARRLAGLVVTGALNRDGLIRWDDELPAIITHAAPEAAAALAARRLAPIRDRSPQRERMLRETLAAWLDHPGQPQAIAQVLHLHPQTVRYRLDRLRDRLGPALDDPQARFELALALRCATTS